VVAPRHLINDDGGSFADELTSLKEALDSLANEDRRRFRDENAAAIAAHPATQMLIVAGPGAGKSHLFMARIKHWLPLNAGESIYVSSFVRKLVRDLEKEIATSKALDDADRQRVTVTTLHSLARSLLERNHGTAEQTLEQHIKIISGDWESVLWQDVLKFHSEANAKTHSHKAFARQYHTEEFEAPDPWEALRASYLLLGRFYNAVGFADLIVLAREALEQNPELNSHLFWIIDEFQDFNPAEEHLIRAICSTAHGVLIAGDDEQALYQQLKSSLPEIIISYYGDEAYTNAMLPYCSRCSYYVCLAASAFTEKHRVDNAIEKIYLPLRKEKSEPKVQIIATATPSGAVDYIEKFIQQHQSELEAYTKRMEAGEETDPFLLILTPAKKLNFYRLANAGDHLRDLVSKWSAVRFGRSADYWRTATYCAAAWDPTDNFATRKVLAYERVDSDTVHEFLVAALEGSRNLAEVVADQQAELLANCKNVGQIIESEELSEQEKVEKLAEIFAIADADHLAIELGAHPLQPVTITAADEGEEAIETGDIAAPVELLTMVGAKGLSAQHVIVIGCDEVNMKPVSALTFFVALTRARQTLHLLISAKAGGGTTAHPYIFDLPAEFCQYKTYRKTQHATETLSDASALARKMAIWGRHRN
jgi:superfamily I DNA/RNA helicase